MSTVWELDSKFTSYTILRLPCALSLEHGTYRCSEGRSSCSAAGEEKHPNCRVYVEELLHFQKVPMSRSLTIECEGPLSAIPSRKGRQLVTSPCSMSGASYAMVMARYSADLQSTHKFRKLDESTASITTKSITTDAESYPTPSSDPTDYSIFLSPNTLLYSTLHFS